MFRNDTFKDIALKELILGFQDFGADVLSEFLKEIKYMRLISVFIHVQFEYFIYCFYFSALSDKYIVEFYGICVPPDSSKIYLVTVIIFSFSFFSNYLDFIIFKGTYA